MDDGRWTVPDPTVYHHGQLAAGWHGSCNT